MLWYVLRSVRVALIKITNATTRLQQSSINEKEFGKINTVVSTNQPFNTTKWHKNFYSTCLMKIKLSTSEKFVSINPANVSEKEHSNAFLGSATTGPIRENKRQGRGE